MMAKKDMRAACLAARRALSAADVAEKSRSIHSRLVALSALHDADTVLCYVSSKDNEVDTHALIASYLDAGRTVLVPIADPGGALRWSRIESLDELAPARFGILEPRPECRRIVMPPASAPVLVPGIAFTRNGLRIGYGGGYYDRFLKDHSGPSIALAFECQMVEAFDAGSHDVPVETVVTEDAVHFHREDS